MKKIEVVRDAWRVLSRKFVRHQDLPYGCTFILRRSDGRKTRNDMTFNRRVFHGRATDEETVTALIQDYLKQALFVNLAEKHLRVRLFTPDGKEVNGKMLVGNLRKLGPTPNEVRHDKLHEAQIGPEIDEVSKLADMEISTAEEARDDPEEIVLRGYIRALGARYGKAAFADAAKREYGAAFV
jgi:hypothetical protein